MSCSLLTVLFTQGLFCETLDFYSASMISKLSSNLYIVNWLLSIMVHDFSWPLGMLSVLLEMLPKGEAMFLTEIPNSQDYCKILWEATGDYSFKQFTEYNCLNPLTPRSDLHATSPYNLHTLSSKQVMRILRIIVSKLSSWSNTKFSSLIY